MRYAKIFNNAIVEIRQYTEQPECKYVNGLPTIRRIVDAAKPPYDAITQGLQETFTILDDRVEAGWALVALPPETVAANQEQAELAADRATVKADAQVQAFIAMTLPQIDTYIDNNVSDPGTRKVLKLIARMLRILARREYR